MQVPILLILFITFFNATFSYTKDIYCITNLDSYGMGSFNQALTKGNREIVFNVSGVVFGGPFTVQHDSITIRGNGIILDGGLKIMNCNNVFVENVITQNGDHGLLVTRTTGKTYNINVKNSTFRWAADENIDIWGTDVFNIFITDCFIYEGKPSHSSGIIVNADSIVIERNLFHSNDSRNPLLKGKGVYAFKENIIVNWLNNNASQFQNSSKTNVVGNQYFHGLRGSVAKFLLYDDSQIYIKANIDCTFVITDWQMSEHQFYANSIGYYFKSPAYDYRKDFPFDFYNVDLSVSPDSLVYYMKNIAGPHPRSADDLRIITTLP